MSAVGVAVLMLVLLIDAAKTVPNERQAQELMLLDALGKKASGIYAEENGNFIDMIGRSEFIETGVI